MFCTMRRLLVSCSHNVALPPLLPNIPPPDHCYVSFRCPSGSRPAPVWLSSCSHFVPVRLSFPSCLVPVLFPSRSRSLFYSVFFSLRSRSRAQSPYFQLILTRSVKCWLRSSWHKVKGDGSWRDDGKKLLCEWHRDNRKLNREKRAVAYILQRGAVYYTMKCSASLALFPKSYYRMIICTGICLVEIVANGRFGVMDCLYNSYYRKVSTNSVLSWLEWWRSMAPLWACMICRERLRPMPLPWLLVV